MAACYLVLFTSGAFMTQLPRELFIRNLLYDFHKSMGVLVMALLTWRILIPAACGGANTQTPAKVYSRVV